MKTTKPKTDGTVSPSEYADLVQKTITEILQVSKGAMPPEHLIGKCCDKNDISKDHICRVSNWYQYIIKAG